MDGQAMLKLLSDRPVAYHPDVARIVGSVKAAVFLCQLLYWTGKGKRSDGFIWKTQREMEEETALSRSEQEGARKKLNALGILEEKLAGIPARLHYRVNADRLLELMSAFYDKQDCGKPANLDAENLQTNPENTPESTTEHGETPKNIPSPIGGEDIAIGEELLDSFFGERQKPKGEPIQSDGDWRGRLCDSSYLAWGAESLELQRQVEKYGADSGPVLRLGYELEATLGLIPVWGNRAKVKAWLNGLASCLEEAGGDWQLVVSAGRQLREDKMTIYDPWSLVKKTGALAAEKRGSQQPSHIEVRT